LTSTSWTGGGGEGGIRTGEETDGRVAFHGPGPRHEEEMKTERKKKSGPPRSGSRRTRAEPPRSRGSAPPGSGGCGRASSPARPPRAAAGTRARSRTRLSPPPPPTTASCWGGGTWRRKHARDPQGGGIGRVGCGLAWYMPGVFFSCCVVVGGDAAWEDRGWGPVHPRGGGGWGQPGS
jgi:hypothetical protein